MKRLIAITLLASFAGCASTEAIEPTVASASTDFATAQTIDVRLSNFKFTPKTLQLQAGKPYALHFVADGSHDFTAPAFFAAAKVAPGDASGIADGQVQLGSGEEATVHLVPGKGEFHIVCTHSGHALLGMKGKIVVQ